MPSHLKQFFINFNIPPISKSKEFLTSFFCCIVPEDLVKIGTKELLVISQDTSAYGLDLKHPIKSKKQANILNLCEALGNLGVWIRLHYLYPYPHISKLIPLMASKKLLPYLDIPFQHSHPDVLRRT